MAHRNLKFTLVRILLTSSNVAVLDGQAIKLVLELLKKRHSGID